MDALFQPPDLGLDDLAVIEEIGQIRARLASVLRVAIARFEQDKALREQLAQARSELSSRKVVDRAKGILMRSGGLGEEDAYHQLRKLAMDRGTKLVEIAQRVIDADELLHPPARA